MQCENLREYCTNPACNKRPADADPDENCEFNTEDMEDMDNQADGFEPGELEMPDDIAEVLSVCAGGSVQAHGDSKPIRLKKLEFLKACSKAQIYNQLLK